MHLPSFISHALSLLLAYNDIIREEVPSNLKISEDDEIIQRPIQEVSSDKLQITPTSH